MQTKDEDGKVNRKDDMQFDSDHELDVGYNETSESGYDYDDYSSNGFTDNNSALGAVMIMKALVDSRKFSLINKLAKICSEYRDVQKTPFYILHLHCTRQILGCTGNGGFMLLLHL